MTKQLLLVCNHPTKGRCVLDKMNEKGRSVFRFPRNKRPLTVATKVLRGDLSDEKNPRPILLLTTSHDFGSFDQKPLVFNGIEHLVVDYHPCNLSTSEGECSFKALEDAGFTFTPAASHPVLQAKRLQASAKPAPKKPRRGFMGSLLPRLSLA